MTQPRTQHLGSTDLSAVWRMLRPLGRYRVVDDSGWSRWRSARPSGSTALSAPGSPCTGGRPQAGRKAAEIPAQQQLSDRFGLGHHPTTMTEPGWYRTANGEARSR